MQKQVMTLAPVAVGPFMQAQGGSTGVNYCHDPNERVVKHCDRIASRRGRLGITAPRMTEYPDLHAKHCKYIANVMI